MAKFYPETDPKNIRNRAERTVYEALQGLGEDYVVIYSHLWLARVRKERGSYKREKHSFLQEGEVDFIILHPVRGILFLEVKGGSVEHVDGQWRQNGYPLDDPFAQIRHSFRILLKQISHVTENKLNKGFINHGYALVFPESVYEGYVPDPSFNEAILDQTTLEDFPAHIETTFGRWERKHRNRRPLSEQQFRQLVSVLRPDLRLAPYAVAPIESDKRALQILTENQVMTYRSIFSSRRVMLQGTAGSGKTLMALDLARRLSESGDRVLFLCYNLFLEAWLKEHTQAASADGGSDGVVDVYNYHNNVFRLAQLADIDVGDSSSWTGAEWRDWEANAPAVLSDAIVALEGGDEFDKYDVIIVDEAQDFLPHWWSPIEDLLSDRDSGRLYLFLDEKQALRPDFDSSALPPDLLTLKFDINMRNPRLIAESGAKLVGSEIQFLSGTPDGLAPIIHKAISPEMVITTLRDELRKLFNIGIKPSQIVLIGQSAYSKGPLRDTASIHDIPLVTHVASWRQNQGILVTTARSFKGMEADVVIIYGTTDFHTTFTKTDLHVAWTRARARLIIIGEHGEVLDEARGRVGEVGV